jgi:heme exporter protein B
MGVLFFVAVVVTMPFALGPDLNLLARIGPAIVWIAALLSTLLGLEKLFQADREDGSFDGMTLGSDTLLSVILAKIAAHWLASCLPLIVAAPILSLSLAMPMETIGRVVLTLGIGTPALAFIGAMGAALATSLKRGGLLSAFLVLPFSIPVLIFGVSATNALTPSLFHSSLLILMAITNNSGKMIKRNTFTVGMTQRPLFCIGLCRNTLQTTIFLGWKFPTARSMQLPGVMRH